MATERTDQQQANPPVRLPSRFEHDASYTRLLRDLEKLDALKRQNGARYVSDLCEMRERLACLIERAYDNLSGWQTVQLARRPGRPRFSDYVKAIVRDFCELHGDRAFGDDRAIVTGFGRIAGHRVLLVGHDKGSAAPGEARQSLGYAQPEGYRKALRKMKLAEKFRVPVVTWIDTPGAFPGIGAEERGIASAIAENLKEMSRLRVPIICVIIGEGGSGGAIGIGVGDRIAMFRHAYYSVISPEGCASILFRDAGLAQEAADELHLRASDLKRLEVVHDVLDEPLGGAHRDPARAAATLEAYLGEALDRLKTLPVDLLLSQRQERLLRFGTSFVTVGKA